MNIPKNHMFHLLLIAAGVLLMGGLLVSCDDSDELADGDVYVRLGETVWEEDNTKNDLFVADDYAWSTPNAGGIKAFFIYTNLKEWSVAPRLEEERSWIEIWPGTGQGDGRFYIRIHGNNTVAERATMLDILSEGKIYRSFAVSQSAGDPSLSIDFLEPKMMIDPAGETFSVTVAANVAWEVILADGAAEWIALGVRTQDCQEFIVQPNSGSAKRLGRINFRTTEYALSKGFAVEQEPEAQAPENRIRIVK